MYWRNSIARAVAWLAAGAIALSCGSPEREDSVAPSVQRSIAQVERTSSLEQQRGSCEFTAGATARETLGMSRGQIPLDHLIILIQENRAFDHYYGRMPQYGRADVEGIPDDYVNRDGSGGFVRPSAATTTCIAPDTPHSWNAVHRSWNEGAMDGFYIEASGGGQNGQRALAWYDENSLPFYYWLHSTFSMADRWFCPVLGPTWPNRDFIYAGTSDGVMNNDRAIFVRNIFDALSDAGVSWGIYVDGAPRQNCIGFTRATPGVHPTADFFTALAAGSLPSVAFIDGNSPWQDEHPPNDIQGGESFVRDIYLAITASSLWPSTAFIFTYDEGGGFFDHVPPPQACPPTPDATPDFSQLGVRIPAVVVSPYSKPGYVSHAPRDSTSITRLLELLFDLPALTARDANADALLDMFDFSKPQMLTPPPNPPPAGVGGCP